MCKTRAHTHASHADAADGCAHTCAPLGGAVVAAAEVLVPVRHTAQIIMCVARACSRHRAAGYRAVRCERRAAHRAVWARAQVGVRRGAQWARHPFTVMFSTPSTRPTITRHLANASLYSFRSSSRRTAQFAMTAWSKPAAWEKTYCIDIQVPSRLHLQQQLKQVATRLAAACSS